MSSQQIDPMALITSIGSQRDWNVPMSLSPAIFPMALLSCSIDGEDMALRRVFKQKLKARERGTYIDIGCSAPIEMSNTYMFYCYGWRGVCIDATDDFKAMYGQLRPEDAFVHAAISDQPGEVFLYKHSANKGRHMIGNTPTVPEGFATPALRIPSRRLDSVLSETIGDRSVDLFSIDVEGAEMGVLQTNDWRRWKPAVIIMECANFDFSQPYEFETVKFLGDKGYKLHSRIGPNVIMVRE